MKTVQKHFEEKQAVELAIGSFILITFLFLLYLLSKENNIILVIAWPFALAMIIVNSIMFFHLTDRFVHHYEYRKDIGFKIVLLLTNIPITFLYYTIITSL